MNPLIRTTLFLIPHRHSDPASPRSLSSSASPPRRLPARALGLALVLAAFLVGTAGAARVTLKNGQVIEGLVVDEVPDDYISIRTGGMILRISASQIAAIDRESTYAVDEQLGDQMVKQQKYHEALRSYLAAKESGTGSAEIDRKIRQVQQSIEEQELAQYSEQIQRAAELIELGRLEEAQGELRTLVEVVNLESVRRRARQMMARLHFQKARRAMDVVDYTTAEKELRNSIQLDPDFAAAHVELGDLYNTRQLGKSQALEEYLKALGLETDGISEKEKNRIRWNVARISHEMEDWPQALEYYKRLYESNPRYDSRLIDSMGLAFLRRSNEIARDDPDKAVELLREGLGFQPGDTELRYRLAQILISRQNCNEATKELETLFGVDYQYPNAHYLAAQCYRDEGKVLEARSELLAEIRVNPKHVEALVELGKLSYSGGAFNDAEAFYIRALELDPARIPALLGMARVFRRKENTTAARQYVKVVLETHAENREANLEMGNILKDEKNYKEAQKFFEKVIAALQKERESRDLSGEEQLLLADALNRRGEIYLFQDQPRTARNDFEEAVKYQPDYGLTYFNIGQSYIKEGGEESALLKAEKNLVKARELDPKNPQFAQGLGIFYQTNMAPREIPEKTKKEYLRKAVRNYRDYLKLGGADVENVKKWIEESGGEAEPD